MKKSFKGKLSLHRETLRLLANRSLGGVMGGCAPITRVTCGHPCSVDCSDACTGSCPTVAGPNCGQ